MPEQISTFELLRYIRDAASTRLAARSVLVALAMRSNPAKKFVCWPSFEMLAADTLLDIVTIKRTIKKLVDANLISRTVRLGRSSLYFINAPLLVQQATERNKKEAEEVESIPESPFGTVQIPDEGQPTHEVQSSGYNSPIDELDE